MLRYFTATTMSTPTPMPTTTPCVEGTNEIINDCYNKTCIEGKQYTFQICNLKCGDVS